MNHNHTMKVFESKTPKSYKNNKLNNADFDNFTHNDYQVFLYLISKIGGVDEFGKYLQPEHLKREHVLTAKEFSEFFNTNIDNSYRYLKKAVDKLMKTDIKVQKTDSSNIIRINVCSQAEYAKKKGCISIQFTDSIMPYLAQVREKFTLYNLKEISDFNSIYTVRLYELIQGFKETGWMLKSVSQLRDTLAVGKKFKAYKDFKKHTFDHACQEINKKHQINLGYEELKEGRKVIAIKFIFNKTRVHKVINPKTGIEKNYYIKPEQKKKISNPSKPDVLEGQLAFTEIKKEPKPIQGILSKVLSKFKY
mgnify:FL=1